MNDLIDFSVVVLPLVIALLSVYVSIKLTKNEEHRIWWGVIIVLGFVTSGLTWFSQAKARKAHASEVKALNGQLDFMKGQLRQENETLDKVTGRLADAIQQSQDQFSKTMSGLSENIDAITGGKSFCYVLASDINGRDFLLNVFTQGESPLHNITIEMTDVDQLMALKPPYPLDTLRSVKRSYPTIQGLASSNGMMLDQIPIGTGDSRKLGFTFFSINGYWMERLLLHRVDGRWIEALRVTKEIRKNKAIQYATMYESVDPNFPKTDGKVDW